MGYHVRKFLFEQDKEKLFQLWQEVLKKPEPKRLQALYKDNSYGITSTWLIFHNEGEKPAGSLSVFPRRFNINGESVLVGINCDIIIQKQHRTLGPAIMMLNALVKGAPGLGYQVLLAMPNQMSQPVFKRAGYEKAGSASRWSKVLKCEEKIQSVIRNRHIARLISPLIDIVLYRVSFIQWTNVHYRKILKESKTVAAKVGNASITEDMPDNGGASSSADYLKWRYAGVGTSNSEVFLLRSGDSKLIGYIIFSVQDDVVVVEQISSSGAHSEEVLLSRFIHEMYVRKARSIQINYFGSQRYEHLLKKFGFMKREPRDVFINIIDEKLRGNIPVFGDISLFDGDLDL